MSAPEQNRSAEFGATRWSLVLAAGQSHSPETADALEKLCRAYWYPLYAFVRRHGYREHEAQDLTQDFFTRLLEKCALRAADQTKGKFHSFLLAAMKNFLANEWDRSQALKRGGGQAIISIDQQTAEERYQLEPMDESTPERLYERRWADAVIGQVLARLRGEFDSAGKTGRYDALKSHLTGERGAVSYAEVALRLGVSEQGVKSAVHRMRQRFGELMREEIGQTVADSRGIESEMRHLLAALRN